MQFLAADDIRINVAPDFDTTATILTNTTIDCILVDSNLPPPDGPLQDTLQNELATACLPVIVYDEPGGAKGHNGGWRSVKSAVVREVRSPDQLLDQASFFLHRAPAKMPETHRKLLRELYDANDVLKGKKAMIVDDDMRNIFALASLLEEKGMSTVSHDNGRDAVKALQSLHDVDIVLMDIMMPEMDGIDTIREIRRIPGCKDLPIIAVTAKAMKGDREKCMEAGAWDYLSKPVDAELMVGVLRAWLAR